jgi:hypothetical protein
MATRAWEQRFRAPVSYLPEWSPTAPSNVVYCSNESGSWQVHTLDADSGATRQVTDHPVGLIDALPTLDGGGVIWFQDETGDESGQWVVAPFHGGESRPFLGAVPHGWSDGLAQAPGIVVAAISGRDGFAVHVSLGSRPQDGREDGSDGVSVLLLREHGRRTWRRRHQRPAREVYCDYVRVPVAAAGKVNPAAFSLVQPSR